MLYIYYCMQHKVSKPAWHTNINFRFGLLDLVDLLIKIKCN